MKTFMWVIMTAVIANNVVLARYMGLCPFLGTTKKLNTAAGMSACTAAVMVLSTAVTWPLYYRVLVPRNMLYMQTVIFMLVIGSLVQLLETVLKRLAPALCEGLGIYLPLITANCAVLGLCTMSIDEGWTYGQSLLYSAGAGIGFFLAMLLFAGIRERIEYNDFPESFKGMASTFIAAAILSLAFMGFSGIVEGFFGM